MVIERGKGKVKREKRRTRGRYFYIYQFRKNGLFSFGSKRNDEQRVFAPLSIDQVAIKYYLIVSSPILLCSYL